MFSLTPTGAGGVGAVESPQMPVVVDIEHRQVGFIRGEHALTPVLLPRQEST